MEAFSEEENKRIENLLSYDIIDTPPEPELDEITKSASLIFDAPIAIITLIDHSRVVFKSKIGIDFMSIDKEISFCQYSIQQNDVFIIDDSFLDERFKNSILVEGYPFIRFYAGVPLHTPSGYNIGTFCILDTKPRNLNEDQKFIMKVFAHQVITNFELRKHIKELKISNEKTEKLSKIKEDFFNNMSHELRTPLNALSGFTEILSKSRLSHSQKETLEIVKSTVDTLIILINDILDFSKIESGNLKIEKRPFNLRKLIKKLHQLLKLKAGEKNIMLNFEISEKVPSDLIGDDIRLNQILINLLGNAIKFTFTGSVGLSIEMLNENDEEIELNFIVTDTGIGIPSDKLNEIFGRFQQVEGTTKIFGGSGLGLSISKNLVELQEGKMKVNSELGKGSEFSFSLKFKISFDKEKAKEETVYQCYSIPDFKDFYLLLVEDNEINVKLIQKVFEKTGMHIYIAKNGKICIEELTKNNYDIILMDLNMPIMDGYETTRYIRKIMNLDIPIIGLSANISDLVRTKCLEEGMNAFISKPFKIKDLFYSVSDALCKNDNLGYSHSIIKPKQRKRKYLLRRKSSLFNSPTSKTRERTNIKKKNVTKLNSTYGEDFRIDSSIVLIPDTPFTSNEYSECILYSTPTYYTCSNEPITLDNLKEYSCDDKDFEKQIIECFLIEMPVYPSEFEEEVRKKNFEKIKQAAHKMKSPLEIFGLNYLKNMLIEVEELCIICDLDSISKLTNLCTIELNITLYEMKNLLDSFLCR